MKTSSVCLPFAISNLTRNCGRLLLIGLAVATWPNQGYGQAITPAWEYLINKLPAPLPVFTNQVPYTTDNDVSDGTSTMDILGALKRYDANRLILAIFENGIDESNPNTPLPLLMLATNYPDRSLIWINPTNGAPLGLALDVGLRPVTLGADFVAASTANGFNPYAEDLWTFDVSADGYIYTGFRNTLLRYAPNGSGGISPTPQVIYTLSTNDLWSATSPSTVSYTRWSNWRWSNIRVSGTGTNTVLMAGCNAGGRGAFRLSTPDGNNFVIGAYLPAGFGNAAGGTFSTLIPSQDASTPTDAWLYGGSYPGNSAGIDTTLYRFTAAFPYTTNQPFAKDNSFIAQGDAGSNCVIYTVHFLASADANPNLNYIATYSTPSWNSIAIGTPQEQGWLGLHNLTNGDLIASCKISVTEADELLPADQAALFAATYGYVTVSTPSNGPMEILWSSPVYGYGRYLISDNAKRFTLDKNINPIWEILDASANSSWPIINSHVDTNAPVSNDNTATMTMLTGLKRYDANRLLLGIRDNGINETVAHNTNLANQFPDRSLQWVDAATGNPLGTALVVDYAALGYSVLTLNKLQNMAFGVDEAGVVYVGVADKIIRYAPAANHTNFLAPTVAFDASTSGISYNADMLFANFRISGSGGGTVIFAGNKDWYGDGEWYLTTSDGAHFVLGGPGYIAYGGFPRGGGNSSIVPDPANPSDNLVYDTGYPSTSNGIDSTMARRRQSGGSGSFISDPFTPEQLPGNGITNGAEVLYRTFFLTDVQTLPGLDYVVAYSTPSYNTYATTYPPDTSGIYNGGNDSVSNALRGASSTIPEYQPGWLAIHDQATGNVRGLHLLDVTEALTLIPGYPFPAPHADTTMGNFQDEIPQGGIEMYPFGNGGSEVLWWSTTYGIGRYTIDAPPSAGAPKLSIRNVPGGMVRVDWTGLGCLQSAPDVAGPYVTIPNSVSGYTFVPGSTSQYFRVIVQ